MIKILFPLLLLLTLKTNAQEKTNGGIIKGSVMDSLSKNAVEYATITLYQQGNKKVITGTVTSKEGLFTLNEIVAGNYSITIEFIGYASKKFNNITIAKKTDVVDLSTVYLIANQQTLQNVTLNSSNRLIENKIDKLVFNAEKDVSSLGGVATDILRKVPQVSVDVDGNVQLAGNSSIRFLINGKPSAAFGSSIADVLQSIPASQIKSIEVITNPGAKYDAQGLGGIINIILKQSKVKGINGNISLTAGSRNENGSFNFNVRKGNFGVNAFVSGNARLKSKTNYSSNRQSVDKNAAQKFSFTQDGYSQFKRQGTEAGTGFDWTFNKTNSITGSANYSTFGNSGKGFIDQLQSTYGLSNGNLISSLATINNTTNKYASHNADFDLDYKKTFAKEDQELEIDLNTTLGKNNIKATNNQFLLPMDSLFYGNNSFNPGTENETELTIDYVQPFGETIKWGLGTDATFSEIKSHSNISGFDPFSKNYLYDTSLSYSLDYKQQVYAFYSEFTFPVGKLADAKIGGRYERTQINSFYSNAKQQAPKKGYDIFVPSIFFSRKLNDKEIIKLSYTKRIQRPDYEDLNPFTNISDSKNITAGNPNLLAEKGHRIELSYNKSFEKAGSFMITAFHRINLNDIQPFLTFYPSIQIGDSIYTNATVSMRQNIGTEKNSGINIFTDVHINTALTLRSNLSFFYRHTINKIDAGYNSNSFNYRMNLNASYQFSKNLAGEFFGNFNSARNEAQGKYPSFTSYSMAIRKQFLNKKASIALSASNPFAKYVDQRTQLFGPNFTTNSLRQIPFRSFGINLTWKFGKLEFKKDENKTDVNTAVPEGQ